MGDFIFGMQEPDQPEDPREMLRRILSGGYAPPQTGIQSAIQPQFDPMGMLQQAAVGNRSQVQIAMENDPELAEVRKNADPTGAATATAKQMAYPGTDMSRQARIAAMPFSEYHREVREETYGKGKKGAAKEFLYNFLGAVGGGPNWVPYRERLRQEAEREYQLAQKSYELGMREEATLLKDQQARDKLLQAAEKQRSAEKQSEAELRRRTARDQAEATKWGRTADIQAQRNADRTLVERGMLTVAQMNARSRAKAVEHLQFSNPYTVAEEMADLEFDRQQNPEGWRKSYFQNFKELRTAGARQAGPRRPRAIGKRDVITPDGKHVTVIDYDTVDENGQLRVLPPVVVGRKIDTKEWAEINEAEGVSALARQFGVGILGAYETDPANIQRAFGPIMGQSWVRAVRQGLGLQGADEQTVRRAMSNMGSSEVLKFTGAASSIPERKELLSTMPKDWTNPQVATRDGILVMMMAEVEKTRKQSGLTSGEMDVTDVYREVLAHVDRTMRSRKKEGYSELKQFISTLNGRMILESAARKRGKKINWDSVKVDGFAKVE